MMEHSSKPIHLSLTDIESPSLAKDAVGLFKSILAWAGERSDPHPTSQGRAVLAAVHAHAPLRGEVYVQILKQLTATPRPEPAHRYWELLALCLLTAPPGAGAEDFVHAFILQRADEAAARKLVSQLHRGQYGEQLLAEVPPAEKLNEIARSFFGLVGRQSSRFSAQDLITANTAAAAAAAAADGGGEGAPTHMMPPKLSERTPDV